MRDDGEHSQTFRQWFLSRTSKRILRGLIACAIGLFFTLLLLPHGTSNGGDFYDVMRYSTRRTLSVVCLGIIGQAFMIAILTPPRSRAVYLWIIAIALVILFLTS